MLDKCQKEKPEAILQNCQQYIDEYPAAGVPVGSGLRCSGARCLKSQSQKPKSRLKAKGVDPNRYEAI